MPYYHSVPVHCKRLITSEGGKHQGKNYRAQTKVGRPCVEERTDRIKQTDVEDGGIGKKRKAKDQVEG